MRDVALIVALAGLCRPFLAGSAGQALVLFNDTELERPARLRH